MKLVLAIAAVALAGCYLPVATGTPQPATTIGTGRVAAGFAGEAPTLDLTAGTTDFNDSYAEAPAAAGRFEVAYGLRERTDVEASLEMSLYFYVAPLPIGGSIGIRQWLVTRRNLDVAAAARIGGVRVATEDSGGRKDSASAETAQLSLAAQGAWGAFRPLASIAGIGARMTRVVDGVATDFNGIAGSVTLGAMFQLGSIQLGPYIVGTYFTSDEFSGRAMVAGGVAISYRPDRHAP